MRRDVCFRRCKKVRREQVIKFGVLLSRIVQRINRVSLSKVPCVPTSSIWVVMAVDRQAAKKGMLDAFLELDSAPAPSALYGSTVIVGMGDIEYVRLKESAGVMQVSRFKGAAHEADGASVRCSFRDEKAMADVFSRRASPQLSLATGALKVSGDWRMLRAVGELFAAVGDAKVCVLEGKHRSDGVLVYGVTNGERIVEHRYSEFVALRAALRREGIVKVGAPFPARSPFGSCGVDHRHKELEVWLRAVVGEAKNASRPACAKVDEFLGGGSTRAEADNDLARLRAEMAKLRAETVEAEIVISRLAAAATIWSATAVSAVIAALVTVGLPLAAVYRTSYLLFAVTMFFAAIYVTFGAYAHVLRFSCGVVAAALWKLAKQISRLSFRDDNTQTTRFGLRAERRLPERLALRYIGELMAVVAESECGLMLKIGQYLATMRGIMAPEITEPLTRLTDGCPPMTQYALRRCVASGVKDPAVRVAISHSQPMASASIAQVHRIELTKGSHEAAIKCQKPALKRKFAVELRSFQLLAQVACWVEGEAPDLRQTLRDAYDVHVRELDFVAEADALAIARNVVAERGIDAVVPCVLLDVADPAAGVLAMRWCTGSKIADVFDDAVKLANGTVLDAKSVGQLAFKLVDAFAAIFLTAGLALMDPHAGNILVEAQDDSIRPVLLDFGMHQLISDKTRLGFARLFAATADNNLAELAAALEDLGVSSTYTAEQSMMHLNFLLRESSASGDNDVVAKFLDVQDVDFEVAKDKAKRNGVRVVQGLELFNAFVRQTDLLHGYVASLPCSVDFLGIYARWSRVALREHAELVSRQTCSAR